MVRMFWAWTRIDKILILVLAITIALIKSSGNDNKYRMRWDYGYRESFGTCTALHARRVRCFEWLFDWLTDWLTVWHIDWPHAWPADALTNRLKYGYTDYLVVWSINWTNQAIIQMSSRLVSSRVGRLIDVWFLYRIDLHVNLSIA